MANLYNHSELEHRWLPVVREEIKAAAWEMGAPRDLMVNYGFDAMHMTAAFFGAGEGFRWKEAYEDQVYGFYLMLSRLWEITAEEAHQVLDNTVTEGTHKKEGTSDFRDEMETLREEMTSTFETLHTEHRLRSNAVIALLMKYGHRLRRIYHQAGYLDGELMKQYLEELTPYAPCVGRELLMLRKEIE